MIHPLFLSTITITLLLVLFAPTSTLSEDDTLVYDTIGEPLEPGKPYYLVPTSYTDNGGGVKPLPVGSPGCPYWFYVGQEQDNLNFGTPIVFSTRSSIIRLSTKLQISFSRFPPSYVVCRRGFSSLWGVTNYKSAYIVGADRIPNFVGSSFTIEDDKEGNYNINFCVNEKKCGGLNMVSGVNGEASLGINFTSPISFVFEPFSLSSPRRIKEASII